ncbi:MAG: nucleoside hydrolase [Lentisphaeria bacterium]
MTLISIGPAPAIAAMLDLAPETAQNIRFTGMFGSLKQSHEGKEGQIVEYNVKCDIPAAKRIFATPWLESRFTPLDSCGQVVLAGDEYQVVAASSDPGLQLLLEHYDCWRRYHKIDKSLQRSSILFDTVAVHLACSTEFLQMNDMHLAVDDKGYLVESLEAPLSHVATGWTDLPGYRKFLLKTMCGHCPEILTAALGS